MVQYERFDIGTQAVIYVHSDAGKKILLCIQTHSAVLRIMRPSER